MVFDLFCVGIFLSDFVFYIGLFVIHNDDGRGRSFFYFQIDKECMRLDILFFKIIDYYKGENETKWYKSDKGLFALC